MTQTQEQLAALETQTDRTRHERDEALDQVQELAGQVQRERVALAEKESDIAVARAQVQGLHAHVQVS